MDKILRNNNRLMNNVAFSYLIEYGRQTILDDNFYRNAVKEFEEEKEKGIKGMLMTPEFKKEILEIARYMAKMKNEDLRKYIYNEIKEERKNQRNR